MSCFVLLIPFCFLPAWSKAVFSGNFHFLGKTTYILMKFSDIVSLCCFEENNIAGCQSTFILPVTLPHHTFSNREQYWYFKKSNEISKKKKILNKTYNHREFKDFDSFPKSCPELRQSPVVSAIPHICLLAWFSCHWQIWRIWFLLLIHFLYFILCSRLQHLERLTLEEVLIYLPIWELDPSWQTVKKGLVF